MQKQIVLRDKQIITYTLKKSTRARRIRLAVSRDGKVSVTVPFGFFQERIAEKFIREKKEWILSKIAFVQQHALHPMMVSTKKDYVKNKDAAYQFVVQRIQRLNASYNFCFSRISIRNQKTRWGSCSHNGNLSFNYKIITLPMRSADYIIVHELCHLKELNHSQKFWNLVTKQFPDYKEIRRGLRRYSLGLS